MISNQEHTFNIIVKKLQVSNWPDILNASMKKFMENSNLYKNIIFENNKTTLKDVKDLEEEGLDLITNGIELQHLVEKRQKEIISVQDFMSDDALTELKKLKSEKNQLLLQASKMITEGQKILKNAHELKQKKQNQVATLELQQAEAQELFDEADILIARGKSQNNPAITSAGEKLFKRAQALANEIEKASKISTKNADISFLTDWQILYSWYHYAGATSNRTDTGTFASAAVEGFLNLEAKQGFGNIKLTTELIRIFQYINQAAAMREKALSPTGSQIVLEKARKDYELSKKSVEFTGPSDATISHEHLNTYLRCLEGMDAYINDLYKLLMSEMKKANKASSVISAHTSTEVLKPIRECLDPVKAEKELLKNYLKIYGSQFAI